MALDRKDLEQIEATIYKNSDDIAISIARSFERMEQRMSDMEFSLYSQMSDLEDRLEMQAKTSTEALDE